MYITKVFTHSQEGLEPKQKIYTCCPGSGVGDRKNPTGEKTGTIYSQLVAQAACRK